MIELKGKKVLIAGLGDSGYESSKAAFGLGANVTVTDSSVHPSKEDTLPDLESMGIAAELGVDVPQALQEYELIIASPGVPDHASLIVEAREKGVRIISELEFGYRMLGNKMIAVTGTNGKTTTTRLIAWMMDSGTKRAVTCGNIGKPLVSLAGKVGEEDLLVVEVSSFQLRNIEEFRADIAVALNMAPDHYDWHAGFDDYKEAKMRLVDNMGSGDCLVYNANDKSCVEMAERTSAQTVGFSLSPEARAGIWIEDGWIMVGEPFNTGPLMHIKNLKLRGVHNLDNVLASAGAALAAGGSPEQIKESASTFEPLEHRMEPAGMVGEVTFINDSKATNPHAALHAVRSFNEPLVVMLGGRNKGLDFTELAGEICRRVGAGIIRGVVLLGESTGEIEEALKSVSGGCAGAPIVKAADMEDSVRKAAEISGKKCTVLFSPACASFDMYGSYKERGLDFKRSVGLLEGFVDGGAS